MQRQICFNENSLVDKQRTTANHSCSFIERDKTWVLLGSLLPGVLHSYTEGATPKYINRF